MVPALWLGRDHPSNYWIAVDSDLLLRDAQLDVEYARTIDGIYVSEKP